MKKTTRTEFVLMALLMVTATGYSQGPAPSQQPDADFKSQAFKLVSQGSIDQMTALLEKHPEVLAAKDERGFTLLHYAAMSQNTNMVALLIVKGADINNCDKRGESPLHYAAEDCYLKNVQLLVSHGAALDATNNWGWTPLRMAAEEGQQAVSEFLISRGATVDVFIAAGLNSQKYLQDMLLQDRSLVQKTDTAGLTPLHIAAMSGQKWAAELLLRNGAKVNAKARADWTPLHKAAYYGRTEVAKVLVANGADLKIRMAVPLPDFDRIDGQRDTNHEKPTAADLAEFKGHREVAEMLRAQKGDSLETKRQDIIPPPLFSTSKAADQQQPDTDLKRQAFNLAEQGDVAQMTALLDKHPEVAAAKDDRGVTPLHYAAMLPTADMAALLLDKGADANAVGTERFLERVKPLHVAIMAGSVPVVELLLAKGTDVTIGDSASPAALAVTMQTNAVITRLVLERVTDINARDRMGDTLLHLATQRNNTKAVELLLARGASLLLGDDSGYTPVDVASGAGSGPAHPDVVALLQHEAEARGKIKRNIAGKWTGKYQDLTLTLDLAQGANIQYISDSGAVVRTMQSQYRLDYLKFPALLEFYRITSPGFEEGKSLWAMIEITAADTLVFDWLKDYSGKAGETVPDFFGKEAAILRRGAVETGAKIREKEKKPAAGEIEVQGMKFPQDSLIYHHPSGEIEQVNLSQDAEIKGVRCLQQTYVSFYMNGNIERATLATDLTIQGLPCAGGMEVYFYRSGKLKIFVPAKNVTINGLVYLAGKEINLYENGAVESGTLACDTEYQGVKCKKGQRIILTSTGKINAGVTYAGKTEINVHDSGKVSKDTLATDVKKIYVPLFANKSREPLIEKEATAATIAELQRDGALKVVNAANADVILECTLTSVSLNPLRYNRTDVTKPKEYRLTLTVSFILKRVRSQDILCEASVIGEATFPLIGNLDSVKQSALPLASKELAKRIVEKVIGAW